jgi:hypothetical protein
MLVRIASAPLVPNRRASGFRSSRGGSVRSTLGEHIWEIDPQRTPGLGRRCAKTDATAWLVVVTDRNRVDGRDASARPIEPQESKPVLLREQSVDGLDVLGARWLRLAHLATRQPHAQLVPDGIGLDPGEVEDAR